MIRKLTFFLFSLSVISGYAQNTYVQQGDKCLGNFDYAKAIEFYKKAADRDTNDIAAWEKLGNAYVITDDYVNAETVYRVLASHSLAQPVNKFNYAQVLRRNAKYEEAAEVYTSFGDTLPDDSRAIEFNNFQEDVKPCQQDYQLFFLSPLKQNSSASDIGIAYCGDKLFFSSNRNRGDIIRHTDLTGSRLFYDLYEMPAADTPSPAKPKKVKGDVNHRYNEGPVTFSKDGKEMIFTQSNYVTIGTDHVYRLGLYHALFDKKKGWGNVEPLPFNSLTYNVAHPSLSKDGTKLYFCSDMPGSLGETDIYVSIKTGDTWQPPVNLGEEINTPGREMFPFIDDDGVLFFSSDCKMGLGGLDVYSAYYTDTVWKHVSNVGIPVNSNFDDFGFITDHVGKSGYFVSNRSGGLGEDDIYRFTRNEKSPFTFPSVYFDSSSVGLTEGAKVALDMVAERLNAFPNFIIEIGGHTDARGNEAYNLALSINRANSCAAYLASKGISRDRLFVVGYGETKIVNRCTEGVECTDEEKAMNRRADFKVIRIF